MDQPDPDNFLKNLEQQTDSDPDDPQFGHDQVSGPFSSDYGGLFGYEDDAKGDEEGGGDDDENQGNLFIYEEGEDDPDCLFPDEKKEED